MIPGHKALEFSSLTSETMLQYVKLLSMKYETLFFVLEGSTTDPAFLPRASSASCMLLSIAAAWSLQLWCFLSTGEDITQLLLTTFLSYFSSRSDSSESHHSPPSKRLTSLSAEAHPSELFLTSFSGVNPVKRPRCMLNKKPFLSFQQL